MLALAVMHSFAPEGAHPTPSYVFFEGSQLLIQSHLVRPKGKWPPLSVRKDGRGLPGPCRLRDQLLRGVDDLQDFCGDVAERDSRVLLCGPMAEGDRRQEQHISKDMTILLSRRPSRGCFPHNTQPSACQRNGGRKASTQRGPGGTPRGPDVTWPPRSCDSHCIVSDS